MDQSTPAATAQPGSSPEPGADTRSSQAAPATPASTSSSDPTAQAASALQGPNPLEVFAQNLLIERGALDLDAELVDGMKADLVDRLSLLANQVMIDALSDQDTAEFEKMVDNGATEAQLQAFAESKIPDLPQRLTASLLRFRSAYLGTVA